MLLLCHCPSISNLLRSVCVCWGWLHAVPCFTVKAEPAGVWVQAVYTCSTIVFMMKNTPVPQGEFNSVFARRQGWPGDLWARQTLRTKSWFWWGSLGLTQPRASNTRSSDTPSCFAVILPLFKVFSYVLFSWAVFFSLWAYINVSPVCPKNSNKGQP